VAAKTLCHFVVEFLDGIQIVYLKSVCKLQLFCTPLSTSHCDTEMEANHTPSQELLLSLFPLWTAVDFPALSCPVSCLSICRDSYFPLMLFTRQTLAKIYVYQSHMDLWLYLRTGPEMAAIIVRLF